MQSLGDYTALGISGVKMRILPSEKGPEDILSPKTEQMSRHQLEVSSWDPTGHMGMVPGPRTRRRDHDGSSYGDGNIDGSRARHTTPGWHAPWLGY